MANAAFLAGGKDGMDVEQPQFVGWFFWQGLRSRSRKEACCSTRPDAPGRSPCGNFEDFRVRRPVKPRQTAPAPAAAAKFGGGGFLHRIELTPPVRREFPFTIPAIGKLQRMEFHPRD